MISTIFLATSVTKKLDHNKEIEPRLNKYLETGNTEWLIDIANFAMIEFMYPSVSGAAFRGTDSDESPGLTSGISYKELVDSMKGGY